MNLPEDRTDPIARDDDPNFGPEQDTPLSQRQVPRATISRMALYLRELRQLQQRGIETVQSKSLGKHLGLSDSQIRRDLSVFKLSGRRGVGYNVPTLIRSIKAIMGTDRTWEVVLIGVGNLGRALCGYKGFEEQCFRLVALFDNDPEKVSTPEIVSDPDTVGQPKNGGASTHGLPIYPITSLREKVMQLKVDLAILAVPSAAAQPVAEELMKAGVCGILNFAPVTLRDLRGDIAVVNVDLALELQRLVFGVVHAQSGQ